MSKPEPRKITVQDIETWGSGITGNSALSWFAEILNGEYDAKEARIDCLSLIEGKLTTEIEPPKENE